MAALGVPYFGIPYYGTFVGLSYVAIGAIYGVSGLVYINDGNEGIKNAKECQEYQQFMLSK